MLRHLLVLACWIACLTCPSASADNFPEALNALLNSAQHLYLRKHDLRPEIDALRAFYQTRGFKPAWQRGDEPTTQARMLLQRLSNVYCIQHLRRNSSNRRAARSATAASA